MRTRIGLFAISVGLLIARTAPASAADQFDIISTEHPSATVEIIHIRQPNVKQNVTPYPGITFQAGDEIVVDAGGCVQTGGIGPTWKRYVNPSGEESEKYYFGEIWIPGVTQIMQPIQGITTPLFVPAGASPNNLFLRLGYSDDGYGDNGYYDHDDGTENQCAGQAGGAAWVTLTVTHNTVAPPQTSEVAPFDLFWSQVDSNWIPFQAVWGESINHRLNPTDHPSGLPSDAICSTPWLNPCTTQAPSIDMAPWPNTWVSCDRLGGPLTGHANWGPGTYQGTLLWESKSDAGADDDYSINMTTQDNAGATDGRAEGYHIEFDSDETVDNFNSTWWNGFHTLVDENESSAADEIKNHFALVTGLVDLDCAHPCGGELHPVYTLFLKSNGDPSDETWQFFVRNWGNEGGCASDDHQLLLDGNKYVVVLPWFPGATKVQPGDYEIDTNSDSVTVTGPIIIQGVGVEYDFQLPSPDNQPLIDGTLHLVWATSSQKRLVSPPVRAMHNLVIGTASRSLTHRLFTALPFGGARDDMFPPMTDSQRRIYLAHLPPPVRHPDKRKVKLAGARTFTVAAWHLMRSRSARRTVPVIRSVVDVAKQKRDVARFNALIAAFGGHYPGAAAPTSPGISGATLNPPPH
jgi:hypothetical protein